MDSFRQDGFRATSRKVFVQLTRGRVVDDFDVRRGTDTGDILPLWKFKIDSPNARFGSRYEATVEEQLADAVNFLQENPQSLTFIDMGCGKGRALLLAAEWGFKQIIGVEFAAELAEIARANLAKMQITNASVKHGDAAEFHFPDTDMVVYLNNPFDSANEIMRRVIENLRESQSRKVYVIYRVPKCAEVLDSSGFLCRLGSPPGRPFIQVWRAIGQGDRVDLRSGRLTRVQVAGGKT